MPVVITIGKLRFLTGQFPNNPSSLQKWAGFQQLGYSQQCLEALREDLLNSLRYGIITKRWINHWGERLNMEYVLHSPNGISYKLISAGF